MKILQICTNIFENSTIPQNFAKFNKFDKKLSLIFLCVGLLLYFNGLLHNAFEQWIYDIRNNRQSQLANLNLFRLRRCFLT